ncbi:hypothetical protein CDD83_5640 [Cordyceps sp. RAO-2017]|nr:hypothetical protein CDD83_5640 [Cordyceps sp. RAO-2017]
MSIPESYQACVLDKPGDSWALRSVPLRRPGPGEILIRVICCGFCLTDAGIREEQIGLPIDWPSTPGHEFIGDVVEVGQGVSQWSVGDRVGGAWHAGHDGTCRQCNQGFFQGCVNQLFHGVSRAGGCA